MFRCVGAVNHNIVFRLLKILGDIDVSSVALPHVCKKIDRVTHHVDSDYHRKLLFIRLILIHIVLIKKLIFKEFEEAFVSQNEGAHIPHIIGGRHQLVCIIH